MLRNAIGGLLLLTATRTLAGQAKVPPARPLGAIDAKASEVLSAVSSARALSDGRVLVNDIIGRRVLLFDASLESFKVVADTTSATGNAYTSRFAGIIPYRGDSTLFVDPQSLSMLVIDGQGNVARVMSIPRPDDAMFMVAGNGGLPTYDGQGRILYRGSPVSRMMMRPPAPQATTPGAAPRERTMPQLPDIPDSMPLVRVELATRKLDTVTFLKTAKTKLTMSTDTTGRVMVVPTINPLPQIDDWAMLSDGSLAIIRGLDYHIDWVRADGSRNSSGKLPFTWRPLNDSMKVAFLDSAKKAMERVRSEANTRLAAGGGPMVVTGGEGAAMGGTTMIFRSEGPRGAEGPRPRNEAPGNVSFSLPNIQMVEPNELPDYAPPFSNNAARPDLDGNVWVRTTTVIDGGPVYDVINTRGEMIDRVLLPSGRVIAGFGPNGAVYMGVREGKGVRLERARRGETAVGRPQE